MEIQPESALILLFFAFFLNKGKPFFGNTHQKHCFVPNQKRQIRVLHNSTATQRSAMTTTLTLVTSTTFYPIVPPIAAYRANYAYFVTFTFEMIATSFLAAKVERRKL